MPRADPLHQLVIVGSGATGLMAACIAHELVETIVLTDRGLGTSNTAVAQGGLQLPAASAEAVDAFRRDIRRSGGESVDGDRLEQFLAAVRPTVELLEAWGLGLDRDERGELVRRLAGGLSEPRIVTAGDRIGTAVLRVLRSKSEDLGVVVRTQTQVVDLVRVDGSFVVRTAAGDPLRAQAVLLAVGGGAFEFARQHGAPTSNPANRNTLLYQAVRRLGVPEVDTELYQYQPYGIVDPVEGFVGKCVPESVVELGARVVGADGCPLAPASADRRELTAAMFAAMEAGRTETTPSGMAVCRLTLGEVDRTVLDERYPHLGRMLDREAMSSGDVYVVPVIHYQLGGFTVRGDGSTVVPGLFLGGEMTGGMHGRNRLMGNGITQSLVDGHLAGRSAAAYLLEMAEADA